jgi:hypothetical protein
VSRIMPEASQRPADCLISCGFTATCKVREGSSTTGAVQGERGVSTVPFSGLLVRTHTDAWRRRPATKC